MAVLTSILVVVVGAPLRLACARKGKPMIEILKALWSVARTLEQPAAQALLELAKAAVAGEKASELQRRAEKLAWLTQFKARLTNGGVR